LKANAHLIGLLAGCSLCAVAAAACSAVLGGIEPGYVPEAGLDGTTTRDAGGEAGSQKDQNVPDVAVINDVFVSGNDAGCAAPTDPSLGVFVTTGGSDADPCTQTHPCLTIGHALSVAGASGKAIVYVAAGTYTESVTVTSGDHVFGGYQNDPSHKFEPICTNTNQAVTIVAPNDSNKTVTGSNIEDITQLANLTIMSKAAANAGETLYGVFVTNSNAALVLDNVSVVVAAGGAGASGTTGDAGTNGGSSCSSGDGGSGSAPGMAGSPASDAGLFGPSGYAPSSGAAGGAGAAAENGAIITKASCVNCLTCKYLVTCNITDAGKSCGDQGNPGCGGGAGQGGGAGGGGGSSIGVFLWNSSVASAGGNISAGNGGTGGMGGLGGAGGMGSTGAMGTSGASCTDSCTGLATGCTTSTGAGSGGQNGNGGNGSNGGPGGGGSGGSSYAVYVGGGGKFSMSETTLSAGDAGSGAGGAPSGVAKTQGP
jgi:hypothetical protein